MIKNIKILYSILLAFILIYSLSCSNDKPFNKKKKELENKETKFIFSQEENKNLSEIEFENNLSGFKLFLKKYNNKEEFRSISIADSVQELIINPETLNFDTTYSSKEKYSKYKIIDDFEVKFRIYNFTKSYVEFVGNIPDTGYNITYYFRRIKDTWQLYKFENSST